jgi:hypothetical protein
MLLAAVAHELVLRIGRHGMDFIRLSVNDFYLIVLSFFMGWLQLSLHFSKNRRGNLLEWFYFNWLYSNWFYRQ